MYVRILCAEEEREYTPIKIKTSNRIYNRGKNHHFIIVKERPIFLILDSLLY